MKKISGGYGKNGNRRPAQGRQAEGKQKDVTAPWKAELKEADAPGAAS
ncbi:MAG: hypothetical protein ACLTER_12755 [Ruminococcus sp.]